MNISYISFGIIYVLISSICTWWRWSMLKPLLFIMGIIFIVIGLFK